MNCKQAHEAMLLAQSGELTAGRASTLNRHVKTCAACRAYQADLARVTTAARNCLLDCTVSERTLQRIQTAAATQASSTPVGLQILPGWRPAIAIGAAAALVLLLGVAVWHPPATDVAQPQTDTSGTSSAPSELLAWNPDIDDQLESLDTLLVMAVDDSFTTQESSESLDSLAEDLLELESWSI